jgi:hypothetical protein
MWMQEWVRLSNGCDFAVRHCTCVPLMRVRQIRAEALERAVQSSIIVLKLRGLLFGGIPMQMCAYADPVRSMHG